MTTRFINPFTDYGFKRLFGTEANKPLLIDFLNQFLPEKHRVADLYYARTEHLGLNEMDRKAVFDVYCVSRTGDRFIVELQKARQLYFKDRSIFYASFPIQEQGQTGDWNFKLAAVYAVAVLNFVLPEHESQTDVISIVQLKDQHGRVFYDKLTFIYLEMPKFTKTINQLETQADKWQYLFNNLDRLEQRPPELKESVFERLFDAAEVAKFSKEERDRYEQSLKSYRDLKNVLDFAEMKALEEGIEQGFQQGLEKGIEQGLEKGIEQGLEKGIEQGFVRGIERGIEKGIEQGIQQGIQKGLEQGVQQGIQKGIEQGVQQGIQKGIEQGVQQGIEQGIQQGLERGIQHKAIETARNALALGLAVPDIAKLTGLAEATIQSLINE